jgi:hypothetical protein
VANDVLPPFSARYQGAHAQIENDFPESARIGLLHLIDRLVEKKYVEDARSVTLELQRIARVRSYYDDYPAETERLLLSLPWQKVFDFCERLYGHLTQDVTIISDHQTGEWDIITPKSEVQEYVAAELQRLFVEENLAFEFSSGQVRRRGRRNTAAQVSRGEFVLSDPRLGKARAHFNKALKYFRSVSDPDPENTVKEAVCAVEATARALFPSNGKNLQEIMNSICGSDAGQIPKAIAKTFDGLYGFRNGGDGVAHGGATGGAATKEIAEYALAVAASQIVLLVAFEATLESDIPF